MEEGALIYCCKHCNTKSTSEFCCKAGLKVKSISKHQKKVKEAHQRRLDQSENVLVSSDNEGNRGASAETRNT